MMFCGYVIGLLNFMYIGRLIVGKYVYISEFYIYFEYVRIWLLKVKVKMVEIDV